MSCSRCGSDRIVEVSAKSSDLNTICYQGKDQFGYVPYGFGIGGGDYLEVEFCANCGQMKGTWPLPEDISLEE
jgi:hypothetical protein